MKQTIRIIGGKFRGKKLQFPDVNDLRPTPDRVRETIFNWLMHDIRNARCLDAFSGSGALGFEAFSRGALETVLVEQLSSAYTNLKKIAAQFNANHIKVIHSDACEYLKTTTNQFDIVFLDPPFSKNYLPECLSLLARANVLAKTGLVYIESGEEILVDERIWQNIRLKQAGKVYYGLYQRRTE